MLVSKAQYAQVAQLVEQWTENPRVGGSNPPLGTIFLKNGLVNHLITRLTISPLSEISRIVDQINHHLYRKREFIQLIELSPNDQYLLPHQGLNI